MTLKLEDFVTKLKEKGISPEVKKFKEPESETLVQWKDKQGCYYDVWFGESGIIRIYSGIPGDFDFMAERHEDELYIKCRPDSARYQRLEEELKGLGIKLVK